jgi:hypothetical protein
VPYKSLRQVSLQNSLQKRQLFRYEPITPAGECDAHRLTPASPSIVFLGLLAALCRDHVHKVVLIDRLPVSVGLGLSLRLILLPQSFFIQLAIAQGIDIY